MTSSRVKNRSSPGSPPTSLVCGCRPRRRRSCRPGWRGRSAGSGTSRIRSPGPCRRGLRRSSGGHRPADADLPEASSSPQPRQGLTGILGSEIGPVYGDTGCILGHLELLRGSACSTDRSSRVGLGGRRREKTAADDSGGSGEDQAGEGVWHGISRFRALGGIVARGSAGFPTPERPLAHPEGWCPCRLTTCLEAVV